MSMGGWVDDDDDDENDNDDDVCIMYVCKCVCVSVFLRYILLRCSCSYFAVLHICRSLNSF